ncbi:hypothetical protein F511_26071 [Dorcoceras hygrometricum]|uniref:Uncharacterized protein n=1 Tax=Dorcoceras hygrometricum TaxID=472368 RepID=A0A2Z7AKY1_9LAMI|nr:hypothetical protein F511_26071 [Dorcoceras hygrometricum]
MRMLDDEPVCPFKQEGQGLWVDEPLYPSHSPVWDLFPIDLISDELDQTTQPKDSFCATSHAEKFNGMCGAFLLPDLPAEPLGSLDFMVAGKEVPSELAA